MRILEAGTPLALPAKCIACGYGGNKRRFMDVELDIDFYGVVYLCESCVNIWFNEWESPLIASMRRDMGEAQEQIGRLEHERDVLLSTIRAFDLPVPVPVGQLSISDDSPAEKSERPRRYPDDFNKPGSESRSNDVLDFTS